MTRMICPYDEQQCDHPRCIDPTLQNYYDSRCVAALAAVVTDPNPLNRYWSDRQQRLEAVNRRASQEGVTVVRSRTSKIEDAAE